ncbi:MAG: hypothetical protein JSV56_07995 [Methanomassiliicoccales archaeon]|nr:MAG: hypothetical protein JSV56_07995 [Methanomassiliicoccales archaeon]
MKKPPLGLAAKLTATVFLAPMIPIWVPKRRYPQSPIRVVEPEFIEATIVERRGTKECAICRRSNADYEHSCGVAFHRACIHQYFEALSDVDGAERICPHCYEPFPLDLESEKEGTVEVSSISDETYNQYLEVSDEFSIALIDGRIRDVSVFLSSPTGEQYFVNVDFGYYPKKPTFSFSDDLLMNIEGLGELLEVLSNWDPEFPPRLVDVLLDIQARIRPKIEEEQKFEEEIEGKDLTGSEEEEDTKTEEDQEVEYVEVLPVEEIVEVTPEDPERDDEAMEMEEILPATFFEIDSMYEPEFSEDVPSFDSFENEEAIQQYLDLNNSFSVELIDDEVYHVITYLSSLDAGIYNIYPITIRFKDYPEKPALTFTDDLLVRIRGLDEILRGLGNWNPTFPQKLVDILQLMETRLVEDSLIESELEVIKREFKTRRIGKNRIVITLATYGQKSYDVEMGFTDYPSPPIIYLPDELKEIYVEELDGIMRWQERPQKRIMDVIRSLSQAINNLYRMEFEEMLMEFVADSFESMDSEYHVEITVPTPKEKVHEEEVKAFESIRLKIRVPTAYPLLPPEIEADADSQGLKNEVDILLVDVLKSWAPSMFIADVINDISLSLSNTSLFKCGICGQKECPTCGLALLTVPMEENEEICEVPCIQCKRPYHVHCLSRVIDDGITECGFCLTDFGGFFRKHLQDIAEKEHEYETTPP